MHYQENKYWSGGVRITSLLFALFVVYTAGFGVFPHLQQRSLVAFFGIVLALATTAAVKQARVQHKIPWWDLILIVLVMVSCLNMAFRYEYYLRSYATIDKPFEYIVAALLLIITVEASRRVVGWTFPILTVAIILYCLFGHLIPGYWGHGEVSYSYFSQFLYQSDMGIWGLITGVVASLVSIYILFGALLQYTGGGETFIKLAQIVAGRFRGGPAMVAVIASAGFGTMSGSTVANVATTGNFTIPLMKRLGYSAHFAGGVESAASTGGNIMPPIMGAAAFVMAELLGIPYLSVCIAAAVPAILYFISVLISVRLEAVRTNLRPIPEDEIPKPGETLRWGKLAPLFLPVIALLAFLFMGYDPYRACFYAFATAVVLYLFTDFSPRGWIYRFKNIISALEKGGLILSYLVPLLVCAQIFISLISLSGLGAKLSFTIISVTGQNLFVGLILAAVVALILGMGLPTTGAYILAASVVAPPLIYLGTEPLNAHLFLFYFAIISALTPPVCIAVFTAASIAQCSWVKIAWVAVRLALISYIMPFLFIYNPLFLLQGKPLDILLAVGTAILGVTFVASGIIGYLNKRIPIIVRLLFFTGGFLFFLPGLNTDLTAVALIVLGLVMIKFLPRLRWR